MLLTICFCSSATGIGPPTLNEAPKLVVALDPARAAGDFGSSRWLSNENRNTHRILEACNSADLGLPADLLRALYEHALALAVGEKCFPHDYVAAAALEGLVLALGEQARPLVESALDSDQEKLQEASARGIARLAGIQDPFGFACDRQQAVGFEGLTPAQRVVYCAGVFDGEVCNGGIMQFFGNSSGDLASETLQALREISHAEAEAALATAIAQIGPLAREVEREMRLAAVEDRYDELLETFDPLERAFYDTVGRFRQKLLLYAARHADDFRD